MRSPLSAISVLVLLFPAIAYAQNDPPAAPATGPATLPALPAAAAPPAPAAPAADPEPEPALDSAGAAGARGVGLAPPCTKSGDFMDTRLSWTFGDDDFLHRTGELAPLSPTFSI